MEEGTTLVFRSKMLVFPIPSLPDCVERVERICEIFKKLVVHRTYSLRMRTILCRIRGSYFGFNFELMEIELFVSLNLVSLDVVAGMA